ncbi:hypothetical protein [Endozoicomonas euniceicola]|uniref:Uncharacterized protein n=1 Tax=Endozoicomonas euniceicola TaxID=1234143 RepID=A0ABY6GYE9_9GAMM|nr:hypothetical protein [Endozoicomonas euniceicola]UYM16939.1 hypothetical protein NX720_03170 [Endozoicomonas euniceicola]
MKYPRPHARLSDVDHPEKPDWHRGNQTNQSPASSNNQKTRSIREITDYLSKFYGLQDRGKRHFVPE